MQIEKIVGWVFIVFSLAGGFHFLRYLTDRGLKGVNLAIQMLP